jgi:ketosteroid isomerase-like protein
MKRAIFLSVALILMCVAVNAQEGRKPGHDLEAFLQQLDSAQELFHNGKPAVLEELWSHRDDVTLAGGTGGPIEKGWANVKKRLDAVTTHYEGGKQTNERVDVSVSGDFASVVQYEHIIYRIPGQSQDSKRDYRITMIFRYEKDGWRLVHRQADSQTVMQVPK